MAAPGTPFSLKLARNGERIITREGTEATFIAFHARLRARPLLLEIAGELVRLPADGIVTAGVESPGDVFMAPRRIELWVRSIVAESGRRRIEWASTPAGVAPTFAPGATVAKPPTLFDSFDVAVEE